MARMVIEGPRYQRFPGYELIVAGVGDLAAGRESVNALLVASFARRLRALGIDVPERHIREPEHRLYERLVQVEADGAHAAYNALVRRALSFAEAAECAG